jgi:hypothetical protein
MKQGRFTPPKRKVILPAGGPYPSKPSCQEHRVTNPGPPPAPFRYDFMVPEEQDSYGSGTTFIRVPIDPTESEKEFVIEQTVLFLVRFDPEKKETYLLERRISAD